MNKERPVYTFGNQTIWEEDDIAVGQYAKTITLQEAIFMTDVYKRIYMKHKRMFGLSDLSRVTTIEPEARRHLVQWSRTVPVAGVAAFGLGSVQRMLVILIFNAVKLVTGGFGIPLALCKDEAEARAWIVRQRRLLLESQISNNAAPPNT